MLIVCESGSHFHPLPANCGNDNEHDTDDHNDNDNNNHDKKDDDDSDSDSDENLEKKPPKLAETNMPFEINSCVGGPMKCY